VESTGASPGAGQYLTFRVARQDCAIEASCVRAVLPWSDLTRDDDAAAPGHLAGFVSMHGGIFPVVDLARKLGFPTAPPGRSPCIVVIEGVGFVADRVSGVIDVRARDLHGRKILKHGRPRIIIDVDKVKT